MAKKSEVGFDMNHDGFGGLINYCSTLGGNYNPALQELLLINMTGRLQDSITLHKAVSDLEQKLKKLQAQRKKEFEEMEKICVSVIAAMRSCKLDPALIEEAQRLLDKMRGTRRGKIDPDAINPDGTPKKYNSVAQTGFGDQLGHLGDFIEIIDDEPTYITNIPHCDVTSLRDREQMLKVLNSETSSFEAQVYTKRIERYNDQDALVEIANRAKAEVLAVYGYTSPEYKKAISYKVRKIRRR